MTGENRPPRTLAVAIERGQWELAALCLAIGVTRAAEALPPDAVEALLEVLSVEPAPRSRHAGESSGRRRRNRGRARG